MIREATAADVVQIVPAEGEAGDWFRLIAAENLDEIIERNRVHVADYDGYISFAFGVGSLKLCAATIPWIWGVADRDAKRILRRFIREDAEEARRILARLAPGGYTSPRGGGSALHDVSALHRFQPPRLGTLAMSFVGEAIAGLGSFLGFGGSSTGAAAGAASAGSGWLGLSSGFWTALSAGATIFSTLSAISTNNAVAAQTVFDATMQGEASALDFQRRRSDVRRETDRETARRTSLLSAQGGLIDGADLVLEGLIEGARADARLVTDMGFEQGAISRRIANTMTGARRQNTGAVIQGAARITDLLARP